MMQKVAKAFLSCLSSAFLHQLPTGVFGSQIEGFMRNEKRRNLLRKHLITFLSVWLIILISAIDIYANLVTIDFDDVADCTDVTKAYEDNGVIFRCRGLWPDHDLVRNNAAVAWHDRHALSGDNVIGGAFLPGPSGYAHWLSFRMGYAVARFDEPVDYVSLYGVGGPFKVIAYNEEEKEIGVFLSHVVYSLASHPTGRNINFLEISAREFGTPGMLIKGIKFGSIYAAYIDDVTYFDDFSFNVNEPPVANAGADQTLSERETVMLDGSNSYDWDFRDFISYQWDQIEIGEGDPTVILSGADTANPTFTGPDVGPVGASLNFLLTVTDAGGLKDTDECIVNVTWENEPPRANAGDDQTVIEGDTVVLDASNSFDPDGGIDSYQWKLVSGSVTLSNATSVDPTFVAPPVDVSGTVLSFELVVSDGAGLSDSDTIIVTVGDNGIEGFPVDAITTICSTGDPIGLKCETGAHITSLDTAVDASSLPDEDKPGAFLWGLLDIEMKVDTPAATAVVTLYLPSPAPDEFKWYKYNSIAGWIPFNCDDVSVGIGDGAEFNEDRTQVTLRITDNGDYDDDGQDSIVRDPSGLASTNESDDSSSCFIQAAGKSLIW